MHKDLLASGGLQELVQELEEEGTTLTLKLLIFLALPKLCNKSVLYQKLSMHILNMLNYISQVLRYFLDQK